MWSAVIANRFVPILNPHKRYPNRSVCRCVPIKKTTINLSVHQQSRSSKGSLTQLSFLIFHRVILASIEKPALASHHTWATIILSSMMSPWSARENGMEPRLGHQTVAVSRSWRPTARWPQLRKERTAMWLPTQITLALTRILPP